MNWRHAAWVPLLVVLGACGADGGSRGTGIETIVQGNVESVQAAASPHLAAPQHPKLPGGSASSPTEVEGIRVLIEGTAAEGTTDANGSFSLRGSFDGRARLLFQRPADDIAAALPINVPGGGTLTVNNVTIDNAQGSAVPESQAVEFEGVLTNTDCAAQIAILTSLVSNDMDRYTLRLDTSTVYDAQGDTLTCADLRAGDQAAVQGAVNPDGSFGNAVVQLN